MADIVDSATCFVYLLILIKIIESSLWINLYICNNTNEFLNHKRCLKNFSLTVNFLTMTKIHLVLVCLLANLLYSQSANFAKAPNSYIYDLDLAQSNNYGGLEIPVTKAYEMWSGYQYLKENGVSTPIPNGVQSATLHWEDTPGLIESVTIIPSSTPAESKIKVTINKGKGKGNAVIAFKVDGTIYWSWHVWVTDNPENGNVYSQGFETDISGTPFTVQYMDRNLGATSGSFLGNQWQKSGGLLYEWGRKDPFPSLVHKDADFYEISGEVGVLRHRQIDPVNTIPVQIRPFNEIEKNMKYAINNPLTYIINTDNTGNWFSNSRHRINATSPNYVAWDLWSDNAKGNLSNGSSSNVPLRTESWSYELKSELDPCPNGWRVPSYYGRETMNNYLAFFGRKNSGVNDDGTPGYRQFSPNVSNAMLDGTKVYPGLGMDFTNAQGGNRNIGALSIPGGYVYYPNSVSPNAPVGVMFQDNAANGGWWSSTYAYDGARIFSMISDPFRTNTNVGLHEIYNNQTNPSRSGNAVKCMRDPNLAAIGNFETPYFVSNKINYTEGLDNPNSYIITDQTNLKIPVSKAFSVYNQLLSNNQMMLATKLKAKVSWTTNTKLVTNTEIEVVGRDLKKANINLTLNPAEKGNAVISLHSGDINNPALWSWHIWAPEEDPSINAISYTTEATIPTAFHFVNPTVSKSPPLKTVFMDRNLGAMSASSTSDSANGLHYQWGRKDPIPTFGANNTGVVYVAKVNTHRGDGAVKPVFLTTTAATYLIKYTSSYDEYQSDVSNNYQKIQDHILFSVQNPIHFLYHDSFGEVYNGGNHYANDLSKIKDWVSDKRGEADNRWGHADKKSPFDPCPEGWRVPDVSFTHLYTGSKGNSPWYNGYRTDAYGKPGVIQDQWHAVSTYYGGTVDSNGWAFESPTFNIGKFPRAGIRGELGGDQLEFLRSGVWTASLADLNTGFSLALQFEGNRMQTGTGVYPQAGMSVRCAKDEKRLLGTPAAKNAKPIVITEVPKKNIPEIVNNEVKIFPNPFKDEFSVSNSNADAYEMYDLSGKLVLKGHIQNKRVNATSIQKGVYLLKIIFKDGSSISKKMMKN